MINLDGKKFRSISNTDNGEVGEQTIFEYSQAGDIISAIYSGGKIKSGQLLGKIEENGKLIFNYQHINEDNYLHAGNCISIPELLPDGKIRFHEKWQWYTGDESSGNSIIEEI